ncbi:MAG: hypothetical protein V1647_05925 [Pseudomonadota bacterium]
MERKRGTRNPNALNQSGTRYSFIVTCTPKIDLARCNNDTIKKNSEPIKVKFIVTNLLN